MIPLHLSLSGFLSYRDPVELDLTSVDLACISGANGAGKSSLLDAITWVLFGEARRRDDTLINTACDQAEVSLVFAYEGNIYRIQRLNPRGKTSVLEFQILAGDGRPETEDGVETDNGGVLLSSRSPVPGPQSVWKPLTERTMRETQSRIEAVLRMDYETFVNASFFLQGKADTFAQQRPADRKRILSSILGLEQWEVYRQRTAERRKGLEGETEQIEGRLQEILTELNEEDERRETLGRLEKELSEKQAQRASQESVLEGIRAITASLDSRRSLVGTLRRQLESTEEARKRTHSRLVERQSERDALNELTHRADEIEEEYKELLARQEVLASWDETAESFRKHEKQREAPRLEIQAAKSALEGELGSLRSQEERLLKEQDQRSELETRLEGIGEETRAVEERIAAREARKEELNELRQKQVELQANNKSLKERMDEIDARIKRLQKTEGAECPTCGKPLSAEEREKQVTGLQAQGKEMGDTYRANSAILSQSVDVIRQHEKEITRERNADAELRSLSAQSAQVNSRLEALGKALADWEKGGKQRRAEIETILGSDGFAMEARKKLAGVDAELKKIGYDAAAHDAARKAEQSARPAATAKQKLDQAQATAGPLEREISDLAAQLATQEAETRRQQEEYTTAAAELAAEEAHAPDQQAAESLLFQLQEVENRLRLELGAARQKVLVLDDLKVRRKELEAQKLLLNRQIGKHKQLERAFGKDGIPALLIEQALPEIETRANEILERLSGGVMNVRFVTQAAFKDKKRSDLRETLDIQISDGAGVREYELYSGGEAFRVNFAVRLALSEVLSKRAGARLQTLVIDEGFGSQDAWGRQRLIEAINLVKEDFAKVLVITHIDELKDAFPTRIEVEKGERGSRIRIDG